MDESELDSLTPADSNHTVSSANRKRRDLEESMRREAEERRRRKRELMRREKEVEKVSYFYYNGSMKYTQQREGIQSEW